MQHVLRISRKIDYGLRAMIYLASIPMESVVPFRGAVSEVVHQLEGGILRYFEETGGRAPGWRGGCFVFDERVALGADLAPNPAPAAVPRDTAATDA